MRVIERIENGWLLFVGLYLILEGFFFSLKLWSTSNGQGFQLSMRSEHVPKDVATNIVVIFCKATCE